MKINAIPQAMPLDCEIGLQYASMLNFRNEGDDIVVHTLYSLESRLDRDKVLILGFFSLKLELLIIQRGDLDSVSNSEPR